MDKYYTILNDQLLKAIQDNRDISIGLFSGKMGLCVYFYHLGRIDKISFNRLNDNISILIQILYYIYMRKQSLQSEQSILFNELAIHIINILHSKIELILEDYNINFNINTNMPLFLYVLSKIYHLNIYNRKYLSMNLVI